MDIKEEDILGSDIKTHWYYVSKGKALCQFLGDLESDEVLDIGAGSGVFAHQLIDQGVCQNATCVDPGYSMDRIVEYNGGHISFVRQIDNPTQDFVLMMDVLEHVDDDVALLRQYSRSLPNHGRVLISVPAFQFLWSGHDEFLEHRRRYTISMLKSTINNAGLDVIRCRYFYGLLFPVVAVLRLYQWRRLKIGMAEPKSVLQKHSKLMNTSLTLVHDIERVLLFPFNIIAGLSIFCLAGPRQGSDKGD